MPVPDEITQLRRRIESLEAQVKRLTAQRNKAWTDRAEIHARLRKLTSYGK